MSRLDGHELGRRAGPLVLVLVLASWAWAWHRGAQRPDPDLFPFLKRAWPGATYTPLPGGGGFEVLQDGQAVGRATVGRASGYSGPLVLAVGTSGDGRVRALAILEYPDTPDLMPRVRPFLSALVGRSVSEGFEVGHAVDAVTGATLTSRGLARAALDGAQRIAESGGPRAGPPGGIAFGAPEACLVALVALGAIGRNRPSLRPRARQALRLAALALSLATIGFLFNRPWVIAFPVRLLAGDFPSWRTHLYWYLLLGSLLFAFSRSGRSPYCPWICPFGAAQDVVGLPFGARKRRVPHRLLFTWVKGALLWLAVFLGLLYRSPGGASYEVFATFFRLSGTGFQAAILAIVLLAALFFRRPFCHWVCPVDTTERLARLVRVRALRFVGRGPAPHPPRPIVLRVVVERPPTPVFRRLRNGVLTLAGLLCALLVLGHLHERLGSSSRASPENLLGRTFVAPTPSP